MINKIIDKLPPQIVAKLKGNYDPAFQMPDEPQKNTAEDFIPFDSFVGDFLKVGKGMWRCLVKTNAINILNMDKEDQNLVLDFYSDFLNTHIHPYQIYIPSFRMNIDEQLEKTEAMAMKAQEKGLVRTVDWLEDDFNLQVDTIREYDMSHTDFYIVFQVDFESSRNEAKDYNRVSREFRKYLNNVQDALGGARMHFEVQNRQQYCEALYYSVNPLSYGKQCPVFEDAPVVGLPPDGHKAKKQKNLLRLSKDESDDQDVFTFDNAETNFIRMGWPTLKEKLAPYSFNFDSDRFQCGGAHMTVYEMFDVPVNLGHLWLRELYKFRDNCIVTWHIRPVLDSDIIKEIEKQAPNVTAGLIKTEKAADGSKIVKEQKQHTFLGKQMERAQTDIDKTMDKLAEDQSFFHCSLFMRLYAKSPEELTNLCDDLETTLKRTKIIYRKTTDNMRSGMLSTMPIGKNALGTTRNMLTHGLSHAFPFMNYVFSDFSGFFFAVNADNNTMVYFNPFSLVNPNGGILGISGSGKSVALKKLIKQGRVAKGYGIIGLDPENECIDVAESLDDAQYINFALGSEKNKINLLQLYDDPEEVNLLKPRISFQKLVLSKMLRLPDDQIFKVSASLNYLYRNKFGFTDEKASLYESGTLGVDDVSYSGKRRRKMPELIDLYNLWESDELADQFEGSTKPLAARLREWTRLGDFDILDGQSSFNVDSSAFFFGLKKIKNKFYKEIMAMVLFDYIAIYTSTHPEITFLVFLDEAHVLTRDDEIAEYVYDLIKRIRKTGGGCIPVTQNISDFAKSKFGKEILKNMAWKLLMKQDPDDIEILQKLYDIPPSLALKMKMFRHKRGEGYLIIDDNIIHVNIKVSKKELELFSTSDEEDLPESYRKEYVMKPHDSALLVNQSTGQHLMSIRMEPFTTHTTRFAVGDMQMIGSEKMKIHKIQEKSSDTYYVFLIPEEEERMVS